MMPVHKDLEYKSLYSTEKMTYATVCLDSGKLATEACKNDIRGDRTQSVLVYPEDRQRSACTQHVEVDYCTDGVATEWCKKFAGVDTNVKITKKCLLKLTTSQYNEIVRAKDHGLEDFYTSNDSIYLINDDGSNLSFKGFGNNINVGISAPYKVCTAHTESAWNQQQQEQTPTDPAVPPADAETPDDTTTNPDDTATTPEDTATTPEDTTTTTNP